jgi:hypothetical protein
MDDARKERLARNESTFRTLNEKIAGALGSVDLEQKYAFVCECSTSGCFEPVTLTLGAYEEVRATGTHFILVRGHEELSVESVIATSDGYVIVEKHGAAGLSADRDDPRARLPQTR